MAFGLSSWARQLIHPYPDPSAWAAPHLITRADLRRFINLWLIEGIPFAFRELPMLYEHGREMIGRRLGEQCRQITLIGSARLGYSLAPPPKFGAKFSANGSDLDVVIVSARWYEKLKVDFESWLHLYKAHKIKPTPREVDYWAENARVVLNTLSRGFIDTNKIPNRDEFPAAQEINDLRFDVKRAMNREAGRDLFVKVTFRVYRDWEAAMSQMLLNLETALRKVGASAV